jgi:hypothetical protein
MQAKAEGANSGGAVSDPQGQDASGGVGDAAGADAASLLQQVEARLKAVAAEAAEANPASLQTVQQAGAVAIHPGGRHHRR